MKTILWIIVIASIIAGLIYWLGNYIEFFEQDVEVGYNGEARINNFLAVEYFLKAMGQSTQRIDIYRESVDILNKNDTLIMTGHRVSMGQEKSKLLMEWVSSGGYLIITARSYVEDDDRTHDYLLDSLGISGIYQYIDEDQFDDTPINVNINENIEFLLVGFKQYYTLKILDNNQNDIIWSVKNDSTINAVAISHGQGRVIVLSDMSILHNTEISKYDNAAFIWGLVNDKQTTGDVYYSLFETRETLLSWIYTKAPVFVYTVLVFIVLFIWHVIPRFGPVINVDVPDRLSFKDHILASGNYYWRKKDYSRLTVFSQKSILQMIYLKYPGLGLKDRQYLVDTLQDLIPHSNHNLYDALFDKNITSQESFLQKIKLLENIRKAI